MRHLAAFVILLIGASGSRGQPVTLPDTACERLIHLAAAEPEAALGSRRLHRCGPQGIGTLASLVRQAATRSDSAFLDRLSAATRAASEEPNEPVFNAAAELARDNNTRLWSRVLGLRIMVQQVYGRDAHIAFSGGLDDSAQPEFCRVGRRRAPQLSLLRLQQIAKMVSDDRSAPRLVRITALCILREYRPDYQLAEDVRQIRISLVCAQKYSIKNDLDHEIIVRYDVLGTPEHENLVIPANRETTYSTIRPGTARFFVADDLIAAIPSSQQPCPSLFPTSTLTIVPARRGAGTPTTRLRHGDLGR
jgi:hypothetical protein